MQPEPSYNLCKNNNCVNGLTIMTGLSRLVECKKRGGKTEHSVTYKESNVENLKSENSGLSFSSAPN